MNTLSNDTSCMHIEIIFWELQLIPTKLYHMTPSSPTLQTRRHTYTPVDKTARYAANDKMAHYAPVDKTAR